MATSIKKKLHICATPPSTKDLSSYKALTWIQVKGTISIGSISFPHATIEVPELETGITKTLKGARTGSGAEISYATVASDAGQAACVTANEAETEVSIKITSPDGATIECWTGILHSLADNPADVTSHAGATCTFVPNYPVVKGSAT